MSLPRIITDICRQFFGTYRGKGQWSPANRCDSCPLRAPCMTFGAAPARTMSELDASRRTFAASAALIVAAMLVLGACTHDYNPDPHFVDLDCTLQASVGCVDVEQACEGEWPEPSSGETHGLCNGATHPNGTSVQCLNTIAYYGHRGCCIQQPNESAPVLFYECPR